MLIKRENNYFYTEHFSECPIESCHNIYLRPRQIFSNISIPKRYAPFSIQYIYDHKKHLKIKRSRLSSIPSNI